MRRWAWCVSTSALAEEALDRKLARIQNDLFDLGADLCVPDKDRKPGTEALRVSEAQVKRLEDEIDEMNADLQPLRSFVLPGGSVAAAGLHVARTVSRRAERLMVELAAQPGESVAAPALKYINRLSDFSSSPAAMRTTAARAMCSGCRDRTDRFKRSRRSQCSSHSATKTA